MEKSQTERNSCTSCRYFSQHYSKQGTQYIKVFCGHCLHKDKKIKLRKFPFDACGLWDYAVKKEERKRSNAETIQYIAECINEVLVVLKSGK